MRSNKNESGSSKRRKQSSSSGSLTDLSRQSVGRILRRSKRNNSSVGLKKHDNNLQQCSSSDMPRHESKDNDKKDVDSRVRLVISEAEGCSGDATGNTFRDDNIVGSSVNNLSDGMEEIEDADWEDGLIPSLDFADNNEMTIEFDEPSDSVTRKPIRRATAEEKELAELVHKVHLLCLLARGRLIDRACDNPLIQAALLSLIPTHLEYITKVEKLTAKALHPLVFWFQNNFRIRSSTDEKRPFDLALASALETQEGTSEEIAALSVALFRALNLTARFVSILDVASLKADVGKSEHFSQDAGRLRKGIFSTSTPMVYRQKEVFVSPVKSFSSNEKDNFCETSSRGSSRSKDCYSTCNETQLKDSCVTELNDIGSCEPQNSQACLAEKSQVPKRKGDLEFEMQLQMAMSATAIGAPDGKVGLEVNGSDSNSSDFYSPAKRMKKIVNEGSPSSQAISTAVGSGRVASPLYWAEVFCSGENLTGRWVHVDAINAIVDGELKVEAVAAACKVTLRYVVAFAGNGAKDVTRRYYTKWYKIASQRVNSIWWDAVLAPLREVEAIGTAGTIHLEKDKIDASFRNQSLKDPKVSDNLSTNDFPNNANLLGNSGLEVPKDHGKKIAIGSSLQSSSIAARSSLEDMEFETRALTEPLPTNQQAYRNHRLYAIEKWLTKYQVLHPKGPILGFCSGHRVYPRTCVQTLKTKERWLREGLQVKANELPIKELRRSRKLHKAKVCEDDDYNLDDSEGTTKLYGKWQLEPLCLPHAVNGIVPKNERGQVEVWSEKCLPPGTVHLKLPRVFYVAKRLEIDYAPAMVGFEFKNGQSHPVFDGIVVCSEFKDAILEAYAEEQEKRDADEKKRNEIQALSRWYQLLSSLVTRQRLDNRYGNNLSSLASTDIQTVQGISNLQVGNCQDDEQSLRCQQEETHEKKPDPPSAAIPENHEHVFSIEDRSCDESLVMTKRCHCGFSVQVEEL
ncbi:DNA repair protein RAD4 isoform X2 [Ziziphus jujuba]|uniref:DNA repair protein RAD4 isoform X2 n=1 Tax=Ziziphus jujuba TaxID=326968 RepID=A0A6P3ZMZ0_ZIZJJ|nr:DNA repair protein RAD4 isoform X2 [Ziziphus jujuba]